MKKLRLDLITHEMETALAEVLMAGAEKYSERGWEEQAHIYTVEKHFESLLRHIHEHKQGITKDPETGLHPLKHAFCRLGMMLTILEREKGSKKLTSADRKRIAAEAKKYFAHGT